MIRRVRFIKRAQEIGFTLAEIRDLLAFRINTDRNSSEVRRLAEAKITNIEQRIQTLQRMKDVLRRMTERSPGCGLVSECPILKSIDSDEVLQ